MALPGCRFAALVLRLFFPYRIAMEPSREELIEIIAYALWRDLDLRPRRRSLDDARAWAARVVDHLEACGVAWTRRPATKPHSTTLP